MAQSVVIDSYFVGQKPTFTVRFFNTSGALTDPTGVKFITRNPSGTETVYTLGSSSEVTKTSTGIYAFACPQLTAEGSWLLRVNASGALVTSGEASFTVLDSPFTTPLP